MANKMTATEKLNRKKESKTVTLDHDFAGIKAGQTMFVATPLIIDEYIRKIPYGKTKTIPAMRKEIARRRGCDGTCAISTSIFVRMSAEAALEQIGEGKSQDEVAPFWRLLDSKEKITKKLDIDPEWVDMQRALEIS